MKSKTNKRNEVLRKFSTQSLNGVMITREALKMMTWVEGVENNVMYGQKCYKFPKTHKANVFAQNLFGTNDGNFFAK